MRFLDLFAGIGGFRLGMEQAGHECAGHVEKDKFARMSYKAIHNPKETEFDGEDITKITDDDFRLLTGRVDCICAGFPCQAFSIAGKRRGFEDTRGTMFFEVARAIKQIKPRFLLLENVKGLLSHGQGETFGTILRTLDELGYDAEWKVLNSKHFGVPQNRERVFIVGYPRGRSGREILSFRENDEVFDPTEQSNKPQPQTQLCTTIRTKMGSRADDTFAIENKICQRRRGKNKGGIHEISPAITSNDFQSNNVLIQVGNISNSDSFGGNPQTGRIYSADGISPTLNAMQGGGHEPKIVVKSNTKALSRTITTSPQIAIPVLTPERVEKRQNGRRFKTHGEDMFTITTQDRHGVCDGFNIRKLTPRECWRLQGFPGWAFDRAREAGLSDSQLYKQAGNSVTVNVVYEIAKKLKEVYE